MFMLGARVANRQLASTRRSGQGRQAKRRRARRSVMSACGHVLLLTIFADRLRPLPTDVTLMDARISASHSARALRRSWVGSRLLLHISCRETTLTIGVGARRRSGSRSSGDGRIVRPAPDHVAI